MNSIFIIILNYNNFEDTYQCVCSAQAAKVDGYDTHIILVDNHSNDNSYYRLKKEFNNDIVILQTYKNIGYAGGNNVGIKYAIENNADYLCILNNDVVVETNFLKECLKYLQKDSNIAFISPVIEEYCEDTVQSTGGDIIMSKGLIKIKNHGMKRNELEEEIECDYVGGACMVMRASLLNEIDLLPENYFLFFEETEWCYKAKLIGYRNICISSTFVRHKGSATIDKINGLHAYLMERNRVVFLKRNSSSMIRCLGAIGYLFVKYIYWGIKKDYNYFKYISYMCDGIFNRVNLYRYPFVVVT